MTPGPRFLVEYDAVANEGRVSPRGSLDWPEDLFKVMRKQFQCSYSHDRARIFVGTIPQIQAAVRWLEREGLSVGRAGDAGRTTHPPVVCSHCENMAYPTRSLPAEGSPCQGCGEPLTFTCLDLHPEPCLVSLRGGT